MKKMITAFLSVLMLAACAETAAPIETTPSPSPETTVEPTELPEEKEEESASVLNDAMQAFIDVVNVNYSRDFALAMEGNADNGLGYRTAGSPAEYATGELIFAEMQSIGLTNVTKDEFTLDGWEFKGASLTYTTAENEEVTVELGGYQCDLDTEGVHEYQLVYAGSGTEAELEGLDVTGKIVLVDIDQRANWWINYPAYEAYLNGALCVMAAQDGGYGEISDDALNAQDICGPAYMGAVSVSRTIANELIALCENAENGEITVAFECDSHVTLDTTTYNIVGMIEGKDTDQYVLMSGHYDSYFAGFQDDNAAIGIMLGIAKGLVDSGYQPEKTLVFLATAAEEWGVSDTRYDWSTGAFNEIFNVHPEWAGKVIANINFELPANGGSLNKLRTSYELHDFINAHAENVPAVDGVYEEGLLTIPSETWSDDFSFAIAGIPGSVTFPDDSFMSEYYHSQFDNMDTYSEEGYTYNHYLFGTLMIAYDQCAVSPLNFATRLEAMRESLNDEIMSEEQLETLNSAIDEAETAAKKAWNEVVKANEEYVNAILSGDAEEIEKVKNTYTEMNTEVLNVFKFIQDSFVTLTWEDAIQFPHEHWTNNLVNMEAALGALEEGNVAEAYDEYLWAVDNNWYAYDWSRATFDHYTDYVLEADDKHAMWGKDRVLGHYDLFDVIRSLAEKTDGDDTSEEEAYLEEGIASMRSSLESCVAKEAEDLETLTEMLKGIGE